MAFVPDQWSGPSNEGKQRKLNMRISYFAAALTALTVCSPAMASNSGPYIGIGATHDNVATSGDLEGAGINGIGGTVVAGYDFPIGENAFLGVEANFDILSAEAGDDDLGFKVKNSFGGSARLGFNVSDGTAVYGRVGYQRGRATEQFDGESFSGSRDGLRFGLGLETNLSQKTALRFEYSRTRYSLGLDSEDREFLGIDSAGITNNQAVIAFVFRL